MVDLVTVLARGAPLVPVATLRSRRQGVLVRDARGPVAEVVLDSVQVLSGPSAVKRFREIEVELTGGDESDLERLEQALRAAGATDGDGRPKLLRALDIEPASFRNEIARARTFGFLYQIAIVGNSITAMGLWLLDNCDLEGCARTAAELGQWDFHLAVAPVRFAGTSGSPVNPIATF